jgi:hypothetical protein
MTPQRIPDWLQTDLLIIVVSVAVIVLVAWVAP